HGLLIAFTLFASACDKSEVEKGGDDAQSADSNGAVKIRVFDDNCAESGFIRKYVGRDVMAHFRVVGATAATHAIGLYGSTSSTVLDFNTLVLRSPSVGTYTFRVVVRNKQ